MNWGRLQRESHKLLNEVFDKRNTGYKWLKETHGIQHFSELNPKTDVDKLREIHRELYVKSFLP